MFSENLRTARRKAGLSQKELASMVGVPYQTITKYENTPIMPRIGVVAKIAQVLNVSIDDLLGLPLLGGPKNLVDFWSEILNPYFFIVYDKEKNMIKIAQAFRYDKGMEFEYDKFLSRTIAMKQDADEQLEDMYNLIMFKQFFRFLNSHDACKIADAGFKEGKEIDDVMELINEQENPLNKE